jgi:hypothetical protein
METPLRHEPKNFIEWIRPALEGEDGRASGRAISAFFLLFILFIDLVYAIWYAVYCQIRQSLISPNELTAAHYPLELIIPIVSLIPVLWGIVTAGNTLYTKFTNPQPPVTTNTTVIKADQNVMPQNQQ